MTFYHRVGSKSIPAISKYSTRLCACRAFGLLSFLKARLSADLTSDTVMPPPHSSTTCLTVRVCPSSKPRRRRTISRSCGDSSVAMAFSRVCLRKLISTKSSGGASVHCKRSNSCKLLSPELSPPAPDPLYAALPPLYTGSSIETRDSVARIEVRRRFSVTPISAARASSEGTDSDDSTYLFTRDL